MLERPPAPMLAQLETKLPTGPRWRYEPKLDGFRGLLWRRSESLVELLSRNTRDLSPWFPELVAAGRSLPVQTVIDGEIVIADDAGHSDFTALQERLSMAKRGASSAATGRPAVLLVFDLLVASGRDVRDRPLVERRAALEQLVGGLHPCLQLVEQTADCQVAEEWLAMLPIEGVVAKRADGRYAEGRRDWIKVKRQRTADCVVIGVTGDARAIALVLGLRHADGELHHFGVTRPIPTQSIADRLPVLLEGAGPHEPAIRSRWAHDAVPTWRRVSAHLVCEVKYTTLDAGRWLRQPARFVRWRPDRTAEECGVDQLGHH